MIRLHVIAEGRTEQRFVADVLAEHLVQFDVYADARCVLTGRDKRRARAFRGGMTSYRRAKNDIETWMKEDKDPKCFFTTMFDLYALPDDFPDFHLTRAERDPYERVCRLESAFLKDMASPRFIPYIQMHEFEALIFSDLEKLALEYLGRQSEIARLARTMTGENPELIDDSPNTAPSKRILEIIPEYDKPTGGVLVVQRIGLPGLKQKCRHFNKWVEKLEALAP